MNEVNSGVKRMRVKDKRGDRYINTFLNKASEYSYIGFSCISAGTATLRLFFLDVAADEDIEAIYWQGS